MAAYKPKEKILTAGQLCHWWGISTGQLDTLRLEKGLPYAVVAKGVYIFMESWLKEWLQSNRSPGQSTPQ